MDKITDQISFGESHHNHLRWHDELIKRLLSSANIFLARFNGVDIFQPEIKSTTGRTHERRRKDYWVLFGRCLYFHCIMRLILNCILQYIYDFHQSELRILHNQSNTTTDRSIHEERISQLEQQIRADRSLIKSFGSPYMNLSYLIEVCYIHMVLFSFSVHILPQIYHRLVEPVNLGLLRALADRPRELIDCKQVVAMEMDRFMASSKNFTLANVVDLRLRSKGLFIHQIELMGSNCKGTSRESAEHDLIVKLLKQLASDGFLTPLNRTSKWLDSISRVAATLQAAFFIFCLGYIYFLAFYLTSSKSLLGNIKLETDFMDNVMRCEILTVSTVELLASLFHITTVCLTIVDQIFYLTSLGSLAQECTSMIAQVIQLAKEQKFTAPAQRLSHPLISGSQLVQSRTDIEVSRDLMNMKLLRFLIQYRILVRQSKSQKKFCGLIIFIGFQAALLAPLLMFIHAPVFKDEMILAIVYGSGFMMLLFNIFIVPACYMHSRGADIYRSMSKLLAAADSLRQVCGEKICPELCNSHLILSLRRELHIPQTMIDQFTLNVMGIPFTYENMLKANFWGSLLLLFALAIIRASSMTGNSNINLIGSLIIL